jgi:hypothetical protein
MVGYEGSDAESLENSGYGFLLDRFEHYGPGNVRTVREFLDHVNIDIKAEGSIGATIAPSHATQVLTGNGFTRCRGWDESPLRICIIFYFCSLGVAAR